MKYIILILAVLISSGCATNEELDPVLYDNYVALDKSVKQSNITKEMTNYFTASYLSEVSLSDKKSLLLLNLSGYMGSVKSHYQKINNNTGCLILNGFDENKEPLSLFIEYKNKKSLWLVNYMYISFLKSKNDFTNSAKCPREVESK